MLLALFIALQIADAYTTARLIAAGGKELNPAMAWLIYRLGIRNALLASKGAIVALAVALSGIPMTEYVLAALCAFYGLVVAHNVRELVK